jgi:hypothetical protein
VWCGVVGSAPDSIIIACFRRGGDLGGPLPGPFSEFHGSGHRALDHPINGQSIQ